MAATDKGAIAAASLFMGDGVVAAFNASNARIGVGNGTTAFNATQTDLQGASTLRKLVTSVSRASGSNSIDYTTTFGTSEANFAWEEIGLFDSASGDYMATRRTLTGFGTKASTDTWTVTLTVVFTPI